MPFMNLNNFIRIFCFDFKSDIIYKGIGIIGIFIFVIIHAYSNENQGITL